MQSKIYKEYISIHALREESDQPSVPSLPTVIAISIHALREESDFYRIYAICTYDRFQSTLSVRRATIHKQCKEIPCVFQSTLSVRRATVDLFNTFNYRKISIHALREESDIILYITKMLNGM